MGEVMEMQLDNKWKHRLFQCAGFWKFWRPYPLRCPVCNKGFRCYWDGGDANGKINLCFRCYPHQHALEKSAHPIKHPSKTNDGGSYGG